MAVLHWFELRKLAQSTYFFIIPVFTVSDQCRNFL